MKLITFDGVDLKVTDEAFLVKPIRKLLEADKSKKKEAFFSQMSYLWFMCDPRSSYMYITDEEERSNEIKQQEGLGENWKPSPTLVAAMEAYKKHVVTTSSLLLEDIRISIDNVRRFLRDINPGEVDDKGRPLYQISSITNALKQAIELSKLLGEAEKSLAKDFESEEVARGSVQKSMFEDI